MKVLFTRSVKQLVRSRKRTRLHRIAFTTLGLVVVPVFKYIFLLYILEFILNSSQLQAVVIFNFINTYDV